MCIHGLEQHAGSRKRLYEMRHPIQMGKVTTPSLFKKNTKVRARGGGGRDRSIGRCTDTDTDCADTDTNNTAHCSRVYRCPCCCRSTTTIGWTPSTRYCAPCACTVCCAPCTGHCVLCAVCCTSCIVHCVLYAMCCVLHLNLGMHIPASESGAPFLCPTMRLLFPSLHKEEARRPRLFQRL